MKRYKTQTPKGVQDYLPAECYNKRTIEKKLAHSFFLSGYDEIETPTLEYYDVFTNGIGENKQERMIKCIDDGSILVLRPEMTVPIARIAATKLVKFPARLYYVSNAYGSESAYYSSQREFTQAGIELIGIEGAQSDAEVLTIAIDALKSTGLQRFQIDIGQVEFFKGLMEEVGLCSEDSEQLRELVDQKNDIAIELFLKNKRLSADVKQMIMRLPTLYGGPEVFERAFAFSSSARCRAAVQNLSDIYAMLCDFGVADYVSIDFGMLQSIDYYSGLIFKGFTTDLGFPILSGGRYDDLILKFGRDIAATGFAIGIKRVLIALERQDALVPTPPIAYVVSCEACARGKAYSKIKALRTQGFRVESAMHLTKAQAQLYAQSIGAQCIYEEGK